MAVVSNTLSFPKLYGITSQTMLSSPELLESKVDAAFSGGMRCIQYRDKKGSTAQKRRNIAILSRLCRAYSAQLIINDDIELVKTIDDAGIHLGQSDTPLSDARKLLGSARVIGVTCHDSLALAQHAEKSGASYVAFGRLFPSKTKPDAPSASIHMIPKATSMIRVPIVGIGGITTENISTVWQSGISSVAVCEALFNATDTKETAKRLLEHQ